MGMPVCKKGDLGTGHICFPPNRVITGSENVNVNGLPAARVGSKLQAHCCGFVCHGSTIMKGAETVFVNGIPLARVTSEVDCGETMMTGSSNVFVGD